MLIFELLDQYEGISRRAFFGCATKLNKTFKTNIIEILILIMCIPRKINFLQLGRYGRRGEQRYRQTFRRDFDWLSFNMSLAADRFQYGMKRLAIAIDPSYVSKAGKKTAHIGLLLRSQGIVLGLLEMKLNFGRFQIENVLFHVRSPPSGCRTHHRYSRPQ